MTRRRATRGQARTIARPAISEKRLSIPPQGRVRYELKTPWRNGTTHVEWDAVDFIAKLAALVPPRRAHLDHSEETTADAGVPLEIRWSGSSYLDLPVLDESR